MPHSAIADSSHFGMAAPHTDFVVGFAALMHDIVMQQLHRKPRFVLAVADSTALKESVHSLVLVFVDYTIVSLNNSVTKEHTIHHLVDRCVKALRVSVVTSKKTDEEIAAVGKAIALPVLDERPTGVLMAAAECIGRLW